VSASKNVAKCLEFEMYNGIILNANLTKFDFHISLEAGITQTLEQRETK
jgi:hypothetical protein